MDAGSSIGIEPGGRIETVLNVLLYLCVHFLPIL